MDEQRLKEIEESVEILTSVGDSIDPDDARQLIAEVRRLQAEVERLQRFEQELHGREWEEMTAESNRLEKIVEKTAVDLRVAVARHQVDKP